MSKTYTIILSDAEDKALSTVTTSQQDWIDNAIHERCRVAIEEIVALEVERITSIGGEISGTKEDIVMAAQVKTAVEKQAEYQAQLEAQLGAA
jgi:hypothetical protein